MRNVVVDPIELGRAITTLVKNGVTDLGNLTDQEIIAAAKVLEALEVKKE